MFNSDYQNDLVLENHCLDDSLKIKNYCALMAVVHFDQ